MSDLAAEQRHLDRAHAELERMRARAAELVALLQEGASEDSEEKVKKMEDVNVRARALYHPRCLARRRLKRTAVW